MLVAAVALLLFPFVALAQHNARVGPTTPLSSKRTVCNILDYGGKADNATDVGPAIASAFSSCVLKTPASRLYVPPGNYLLRSSHNLNSGSNWAFQLDGLITADYTGSIVANMLVIKRAHDFEIYSSNGLGAIQGHGYIWRMKAGIAASKPRILRCVLCTEFSIHDILLIDAPAFHLVLENALNAEIYYITIRGPDIGGSDGIDVSGTNVHLHDIMVTNRDECVSVKTPSNYVTVEKIRCNQAGGLTIGSLQSGASVQNILFQNIEIFSATGLMIKTFPGGTDPGFVKNIVARNFHLIDATYSAYITQYWQSRTTPDTTGVQISNVTFENWSGSMAQGSLRGSVTIWGSNVAPPHDITVKNFTMWDTHPYAGRIGDKPRCINAYGTGSCLAEAVKKTYPSGVASTITVTATPAGWTAPATPTWASTTGWGTYTSIPVYTPMPKYPF